ncbi:MAG: hypothetical protein V1672_02600 [Candidatus Diapherotrites archaeon]
MPAVNHHKRVVDRIVKKATASFAKKKLIVKTLAEHMDLPRLRYNYLTHLLREADLGVSAGDMSSVHKPPFRDVKHVEQFVRQSLEVIPISSLKELILDLHKEAGIERDTFASVTTSFNSAQRQNLITLEKIAFKDHNGKPAGDILCITPADLEKFVKYYKQKLAKKKLS